MTEVFEVVVGRIGKPHGLKGEVTVEVRTDEPERRFAVGAVLRVEAPRDSTFSRRSLEVVSTRWHQSVLLARFVAVDDRSAAEGVRGILLHADVAADEAPEDPEEFYDHQLVGLEVRDVDGTVIGELTHLVHGGAQDLLAVRASDGRDTLVPFVKALVPEVRVGDGYVVVADRPGLVTALPDD